MAKKNLLNKYFGQLHVVEETKERSSDGSIIWRCECECGNKNFLISTSELCRQPPRNRTHCNSSIHSINNLIGQRFGDLEVIELDKESLGTRKIKWFCKCHNCNREDLVSIRGNDLQSGKSQTCGCGCAISRGAKKIEEILLNENINFMAEYSPKDLINPKTSFKLRFDFYLPDLNMVIEYDGEQHFYYTNGTKTWNTQENFIQTKERDYIKNNYCLEKGLLLFRIPYIDIEKINSFKDIQQEKYFYR